MLCFTDRDVLCTSDVAEGLSISKIPAVKKFEPDRVHSAAKHLGCSSKEETASLNRHTYDIDSHTSLEAPNSSYPLSSVSIAESFISMELGEKINLKVY